MLKNGETPERRPAAYPQRGTHTYGLSLFGGIALAMAVFSLTLMWKTGTPNGWRQWLFHHGKSSAAAAPSRAEAGQGAPSSISARRAAPPTPLGTDSSISKVPLPLILVATRPGRNAQEGSADIGVNAKSPQTYVAGAILANGARLAEIYLDSVLLQRDGVSVRLYVPGRGPGTSGAGQDSKRLSALETVGGTAPPAPAQADSHEMLTDFIRPSPVYDGAVLKGFQVYAGQNAGVFARLGLQAGDVITAIDEAPLSDPQTAITQLETLTEGAAVQVTIERNGHAQPLSLDGTTITSFLEQRRDAPTLMSQAPSG